MKETREETYKDVYKFSHRLDEIFEQGMPTKAQIIDAFNKFSGEKHIPTDEQVMIYFNNHASTLKDQIVKIPVMARSDVLKLVKWIREQIK